MAAKITAPKIIARKGGDKLRMVTAYDYPSARIADRAGADIILVGDSVANVVLGRSDTLAMTVDEMVHHTAAVTAAAPSAIVVGDMPWLSYHTSAEETVHNAGRLVREGGADAVKLEGGRKRVPMVQAVLDAEIPVMGHLGLTPQSVHAMGGYRVQGKTAAMANELDLGRCCLGRRRCLRHRARRCPRRARRTSSPTRSRVPTIGIGAGPGTDGQVLVFHDVLGLHEGHLAKFVRQYAQLADVAVDALEAFFADVQSGAFPGEDETYHMSDDSAQILLDFNPNADHLMADEAMER